MEKALFLRLLGGPFLRQSVSPCSFVVNGVIVFSSVVREDFRTFKVFGPGAERAGGPFFFCFLEDFRLSLRRGRFGAAVLDFPFLQE